MQVASCTACPRTTSREERDILRRFRRRCAGQQGPHGASPAKPERLDRVIRARLVRDEVAPIVLTQIGRAVPALVVLSCSVSSAFAEGSFFLFQIQSERPMLTCTTGRIWIAQKHAGHAD